MKALKMTKLDPQDAWLPITECRNGNALYAAFHTLCSGIRVQALVLPVAFTVLGWAWGIICLTIAFIWQLYTLYLLVNLHGSTESGLRYRRYITLCIAAFGEKAARSLAMFPILYLSAGTGVFLISVAGVTCKTLFQILCEPETCTAIGYIALIWIVSVFKHSSVSGVFYEPVRYRSDVKNVFSVLLGSLLLCLEVIILCWRFRLLCHRVRNTRPKCQCGKVSNSHML